VRDRSFNFCMGALHRFTSATMECNILAAAHSIFHGGHEALMTLLPHHH